MTRLQADGLEASTGPATPESPSGHGAAAPVVVLDATGAPLADVFNPSAATRREALYRRLLAVADLLAAALALAIAVTVLGDDHLELGMLVALPVVVLVSKITGLYDRDEVLLFKRTLDEAPALFQVATVYTLAAWLAESVFVGGDLGHGQVLGLWGLLFLFFVLGRAAARATASRLASTERCLLVGTAQDHELLGRKFALCRGMNAELVDRIDIDGLGTRLPAQELVDQLTTMVDDLDVDRVLIAPSAVDAGNMLDLIRAVKALGVRVSVFPRLLEAVGSAVEFDDLHGMTLLGIRRLGLTRSSGLVKRGLDLMGGALGGVLVSPILAVIALAVRLDSPGPIFFRQVRIGRHGLPFEMVKFRTMRRGADERKVELEALNEADGLFKIADDPRVTQVGRFLRRASLDELPQLWNVFRGEMSLVGPRPLVLEDDQRVMGFHRRRLQLTPGMTGPWQIYGSSRIPLREMVTIDYLYLANWSLWSDVKILLRTIPYVLARRGM